MLFSKSLLCLSLFPQSFSTRALRANKIVLTCLDMESRAFCISHAVGCPAAPMASHFLGPFPWLPGGRVLCRDWSVVKAVGFVAIFS